MRASSSTRSWASSGKCDCVGLARDRRIEWPPLCYASSCYHPLLISLCHGYRLWWPGQFQLALLWGLLMGVSPSQAYPLQFHKQEGILEPSALAVAQFSPLLPQAACCDRQCQLSQIPGHTQLGVQPHIPAPLWGLRPAVSNLGLPMLL